MFETSSHIFSGGKVIIIILILKVFIGQIAIGQNTAGDFCGTPDLTEYIGDVTSHITQPTLRRNTTEYYPVQIFSVAQSNGDGRLYDVEMMRGLCIYNYDIKEYCMQFTLQIH